MLWLSLGCLALGVGLIWWALANIAGARAAVNTELSVASGSATSTANQSGQPTQAAGSTKPAGSAATPLRKPVRSRKAAIRYSKDPKLGDVLGILSIPALRQTLPIIEGTRTEDLKKGVGHFAKSVPPGVSDNCVLSGHRDTVFSDLGKLKIGNSFVVETATGIFTYQINRIRIVHANDKTVIVPIDHAVLTVTTCYPFRYVGSAPDRYILSADMVTGQPSM